MEEKEGKRKGEEEEQEKEEGEKMSGQHGGKQIRNGKRPQGKC